MLCLRRTQQCMFPSSQSGNVLPVCSLLMMVVAMFINFIVILEYITVSIWLCGCITNVWIFFVYIHEFSIGYKLNVDISWKRLLTCLLSNDSPGLDRPVMDQFTLPPYLQYTDMRSVIYSLDIRNLPEDASNITWTISMHKHVAFHDACKKSTFLPILVGN